MKIPFNKPHITGDEIKYINEALSSGYISGNGRFTSRCHAFLKEEWRFNKVLLTSSCTDALEMAAMLIDIEPGDEIIVPAYTFVSTALAFARQGARLVFADSRSKDPCIDENNLEKLITSRTRAIVPVHYNGFPCEMDIIMGLAEKYGLIVVEDAAHALGSRYKGKLLGSIGHLGCFSFHETKILHCGEGGMLAVNSENFFGRSEILWEKGTNRCSFNRGEITKYEWIDTGSSFLMSDLSAAFLLAQLKKFDEIMSKREKQWKCYFNNLLPLAKKGFIILPIVSEDYFSNYSGFYIICRNKEERELLKNHLDLKGIQAVSHYLDLTLSPYIRQNDFHRYEPFNKNSMIYQDHLLRLPLYYELSTSEINLISDTINEFYSGRI